MIKTALVGLLSGGLTGATDDERAGHSSYHVRRGRDAPVAASCEGRPSGDGFRPQHTRSAQDHPGHRFAHGPAARRRPPAGRGGRANDEALAFAIDLGLAQRVEVGDDLWLQSYCSGERNLADTVDNKRNLRYRGHPRSPDLLDRMVEEIERDLQTNPARKA